jgi:hypothetical protein
MTPLPHASAVAQKVVWQQGGESGGKAAEDIVAGVGGKRRQTENLKKNVFLGQSEIIKT